MKQLFEFLSALRENNNRDWFEGAQAGVCCRKIGF